jgi:hypothetical protein
MAIDRIKDWGIFSKKVLKHIEVYTIPQYQNPDGNDQVEHFTSHDCVQNIKRYINRFGSNARGPAESLRDLIKVAHYAQLAYDKVKKENSLSDTYEVEE